MVNGQLVIKTMNLMTTELTKIKEFVNFDIQLPIDLTFGITFSTLQCKTYRLVNSQHSVTVINLKDRTVIYLCE